MKYPVRCQIVNADGDTFHGIPMKTPEVSRPHIGKTGLAEKIHGNVRITLDDGNIIHGYECWWKPIKEAEE